MPGSAMGLPGLVFLLGLVFAVRVYEDFTAAPPAPAETPEEKVARQLKVVPDDIEMIMADGRVLLKDGSIRKL